MERADGRARPSPLRFAVGIEDTVIPCDVDEYAATGHDLRWRADLDLAAATGATMIRYGLPWPWLNPQPGRWEWSWADRVVDALLARGLEPIIDLVHYGCPTWLTGAFADPRYPDAVAEHAAKVGARYGDRVRWYTPLNEPLITAELCGETARWPPHHTGHAGFVAVTRQVCRGIVLTCQALRAEVADAVICHVEAAAKVVRRPPSRVVLGSPSRVVPGSPSRHGSAETVALLSARRWLPTDLVTGRVGDAHPLLAWLQSLGVTDDDLRWFVEHTAAPDILGVNFYPHLTTRTADGVAVPGWTDDFAELLRAFADRYGRPVFVTETSVDGDVDRRSAWLRDSLATVAQLRSEGVDVVGYTWWPLFTLIDWDWWRDGGPVDAYVRDMGLYDTLADGGVWRREPTSLVAAFRHAADHASGR